MSDLSQNAIEASARAQWHIDYAGDFGRTWEAEADLVKGMYREEARAVLLAASTEIPCPACSSLALDEWQQHAEYIVAHDRALTNAKNQALRVLQLIDEIRAVHAAACRSPRASGVLRVLLPGER